MSLEFGIDDLRDLFASIANGKTRLDGIRTECADRRENCSCSTICVQDRGLIIYRVHDTLAAVLEAHAH